MIWIALAGGMLVLYVVTELTARWWLRWRNQYFVCLPGLRLRLQLDREDLPDLEETVRFEVNADGERGAEVPRGQGLYRVLVAGGSAVEGYLLDQGTCWPAALERLLNQDEARRVLGAGRVHVGNIGRTSAAARDLDLILQRVLPRYHQIDAIVIMVGASDILKWLEGGAPADAPAAPAPVSALFARHPEGPFGWHPTRSAIIELVKRLGRRLLRPIQTHEHVGKSLAAARTMRANAREVRTEVADPAVMLDNFETYLRHALRRAQTRSRHVLVVRQPWFEKDYTAEELARFWDGAMGHPWKEHVNVYYSVGVVNELMKLLDRRAARTAEALGIEQLDLRVRLEPSLRTYYDRWHFTPVGARQVAEAVAAAVLQTATKGRPARSASTARDQTRTARPPVDHVGTRSGGR